MLFLIIEAKLLNAGFGMGSQHRKSDRHTADHETEVRDGSHHTSASASIRLATKCSECIRTPHSGLKRRKHGQNPKKSCMFYKTFTLEIVVVVPLVSGMTIDKELETPHGSGINSICELRASIVSSAEKSNRYGNACKMCSNKVFAIVLKWTLLLEVSKIKMYNSFFIL
jgi:hypothetical protein